MNKYILIAVISIVVVVGIIALFTLSFSEKSTEIDTKFLSGTIPGVVVKNNASEYLSDWKVQCNDTANKIYYDFIMADSFNFTKEYLINMRGGEKIDSKEYNGVQWEIYYCRSTGFSTVFESAENFFIPQPGYLCFASGKNGDYFISISSGKVHSNSSMDTELFEKYLEPLLNNITLKDSQNPPKEYQIINSTKEDYDNAINNIGQYGWETIKNNMMYIL